MRREYRIDKDTGDGKISEFPPNHRQIAALTPVGRVFYSVYFFRSSFLPLSLSFRPLFTSFFTFFRTLPPSFSTRRSPPPCYFQSPAASECQGGRAGRTGGGRPSTCVASHTRDSVTGSCPSAPRPDPPHPPAGTNRRRLTKKERKKKRKKGESNSDTRLRVHPLE